MELTKTRFKQTELGLIPEDWYVMIVSECSIKVTDGEHLTPIRTENGYYLLSARNILNGRIDVSDVDYVGEDEYRRIRKRCNPEYGDVLISCSGSIGRIALVPENFECVLVRSAALVKPDNSRTISQYIQYFLQSSLGQRQIFTSMNQGAQPNLFLNHIQNLKIILPSLPEQKAIAQVLSDTDSLIQTLEQKLVKKRAIKQGAMQQLLTPKEDWVVKKLGELAKYRRGSFPQPYGLPQWYDEHNGTPFVQVYDVDKNMRLKSTTKQKISDLAKDKSVFVEKGNIILTIQGSIGRIALTQYDAYVDRTLLIFTEYKVPIDKVFFSYVIQEKFRIEKENAPGGIIKTITKEALSKFYIPMPKTLEEQLEIGLVLSDIDGEIAQLEQKLDKYKLLKQGLMQELLTGRIRLV